MSIIFPNKKGIIIRDGKDSFFVPHPIYSLKNSGNLRNRSIVVGYVGPNGSGKSVNAARELAISYMIAGKPVYSNMDIGFILLKPGGEIKECRTINIDRIDIRNLDSRYNDCAVFFDEANVGLAEARRAMSDINLKVMYIVQQKRKRNLDIIWSAVSEMDVDVRLRSRTDIFVKCRDLSLQPGFQHNGEGVRSELIYYDYSGMVVPANYGKGEKAVFNRTVIWNKPWWNIYETGQLQMPSGIVDKDNGESRGEADDLARKAAVIIDGLEGRRIPSAELWRLLKVREHKLMFAIGKELPRYGIYKGGNGQKFYIKDPAFEEELASK